MADNKKGFLLYADYKAIFDKLTNEEAGILVKHLFAYVNDEDPTLSDNRLLEIVFEPIKLQLKRDLKNWENTKDKKSENGILGNLKRYNPDLYKKIKSGKISIEDAVIQANTRKTSLSDISDGKTRKATEISQGLANLAVNVNDNVNDTVTDILGAKAPVGEETPTAVKKQDYEKLLKELEGKDLNTVITGFKELLSKRPEFPEPYMDYWNIAVKGCNVPTVMQVTESRVKKLKVRLKEPGFDFVNIIKMVHKSSKLKNESSWFGFDWIFENDKNYVKILEGNYGN